MDNLVCKWSTLVELFGDGLNACKPALGQASERTYALWACSATRTTFKRAQSSGAHAEVKLMSSRYFLTEVLPAFRDWTPSSPPILTALVINRSPCSKCAHLLASALHNLRKMGYPGFERHHFLQVSLGYYQGRGFMEGLSPNQQAKQGTRSANVTTDKGMEAMHRAGWKLCVTDMGEGVSDRGAELLEFLQRLHP